ncbi:MAG: DUF3810 domain-containing protein [Ruminococcaceae bacterium]|nr:DUF3810 domain-containing protein [Oscillospiraceae bacterium]
MKKLFFKTREYVPLFSLVVFFLAILSLVLYIVVLNSVSFADFFNYNISSPIRTLLTWTTVIFPFSIAEVCLLLSPIILGFLIFLAIRYGKRGKKASIRYLMVILSFICLVFIFYVWTYSSGFHTSKIEDKMSIDRSSVTKTELYETSAIIINQLNELADHIEYDETGASVMPYSYGEMSEKICDAYDKFVEKHPVVRTYPSKIKPIILSEPMTYTHISGIYTFMTGEANVNVNYPDFVVASTAAHEMAHQRGMAREDECNFISFAVLLESDDPFLRYSAYLDVYANIVNALYSEDSKLYFELASGLDQRVVDDRQSYMQFFEKYADSKASEVADSINDSYLQANGQTQGTKSYGMIVEIVCAYVLNKTK